MKIISYRPSFAELVSLMQQDAEASALEAQQYQINTGVGRSSEVLKWLPPIPVNLALPEDLIPTIRPVR